MLVVALIFAIWGWSIHARLRRMHDPSKEEDDLRWEQEDWRRYARLAGLAIVVLFVARSACSSGAVGCGANGSPGPEAWFAFWRDWFDALLRGWP